LQTNRVGEVSNGFAHFAFRRASAGMMRHATALALAMTRGNTRGKKALSWLS